MAVQVPKLKRGLFGYRPKVVRSLLTGREIMFARVWQRLQRTEAERDEARAELEACRAEIDIKAERARLAEEQSYRHAERARVALADAEELRVRLSHLDAEAADAAAARGGAPGPEDLWTSLERAERAITDVIERGRRENERQLEAIEAARRQIRAETERLAAWRAQADGILDNVRVALTQFAGVTARLPGSEDDAILPNTVLIPEVSENGSNGSVAREELSAIQELYGSS